MLKQAFTGPFVEKNIELFVKEKPVQLFVRVQVLDDIDQRSAQGGILAQDTSRRYDVAKSR